MPVSIMVMAAMIGVAVLQPLADRAVSRPHRSMRRFAEEEIVLATGPRAGLRFSVNFMPWTGLVLDEFDRGRYTRFFGSGPAQAGKTVLFFQLPALYHLFEVGEDVILGAPTVELARAIYEERLVPAIQLSRYAALLPTHGAGSRGGKALSVLFGNGARVRFLGAGGGDAQRSSYTARVVILTELDKMDEPGSVSREADPVTQMEARTRAFGSAARVYGECTMSVEGGRIQREVEVFGTDSKLVVPCPACKAYVPLERPGLVGWQGAADVMAARAGARYQCTACKAAWGEEERKLALRSPMIVARDQVVTPAGEISGAAPATDTWGFRWNALASPMRAIADVAGEEWRAEQSGDPKDQKALAQFTWAEPWREEIADLSRPDVNTILAKIAGHERGIVPPESVKLTLGIDVGSYVIWWALLAWKADAQGHVVDFGGIDVPLDHGVKNPTAVLASLRAFRDNVIHPGWGGRRPDRVLIDSGYEQAVVYQFVLESGQPRYLACKGYGTSSRHGGWRNPAAAEPSGLRQVGNEWYTLLQPAGVHLVHVHSDHWKAQVHDGFWAAQGAPGSLTLWRGDKTDRELRIFARQIVAEERTLRSAGEKEPKVVWVVKSRTNHYLDATSYARCAADIEGVRLVRHLSAPPRRQRSPQEPTRRVIRTRY
jgi:hypothetical protein